MFLVYPMKRLERNKDEVVCLVYSMKGTRQEEDVFNILCEKGIERKMNERLFKVPSGKN